MSKVYILKRDLPWAKAGSEWEETYESSLRKVLQSPSREKYSFDIEGFSEWFEEKKPEVTFSREQSDAMDSQLLRLWEVLNEPLTECGWRIKLEEVRKWLQIHTI